MAEIVAIDADHDTVTNAGYLHRRQYVYPYLRSKQLQVQVVRAERALVEAAVVKAEVEYVTGEGHGLTDVFYGDNRQAVFAVGSYQPGAVKNKIVHFLSCQTADSLGPDFVQNKCSAYFGYDTDFVFPLDEPHLTTFLECDSEIDRGFADGLTADKVDRRARDAFTAHAKKLRAANQHYQAAILEFNRDHLCSPATGLQWGNPAARLNGAYPSSNTP